MREKKYPSNSERLKANPEKQVKSPLPKDLRPNGFITRQLTPGIDLPAGFIADIRCIDSNLFFVFHKYRVNYDDVVNRYYGSLEDPRNPIGEFAGNEIWGWVLTDNTGKPIPEMQWHIWSLKKDFGYSHVANIASQNPDHLKRIVYRLGREKRYKERYGALEWNKQMRRDEADHQAKLQDQKDQEYFDITNENKWLLRKAQENMERGQVAATNPTKEIITSFPGQTNRTKIVRPLTDKEGGLVTGSDCD